MAANATRTDSAAERILGYLEDNPDAADTLEGIMGWWIPEQALRMAAEEVEAALAELTTKHYVAAEVGSDGRTHYRLDPAKKRELEGR